MEHNYEDNKQSSSQQLVRSMGNNDAYYKGNHQGRECRKIGNYTLRKIGEITLAEQSYNNRGNHHIDNALQHTNGININHGTCQQPNQQRGKNGRQQGRGGCHAHAKGKVAFG